MEEINGAFLFAIESILLAGFRGFDIHVIKIKYDISLNNGKP